VNEKPSEPTIAVAGKSSDYLCELNVPYLRPRKGSVLRQ
jgi:hypothetical protein